MRPTERQAHWIKQNHQERMPPRMVAFDTESRSSYDGDVEVQEWRVGCAIRWRNGLKTGDHREARVFDNPREFWEWVAEFTRKGTRTVVWAHNLGHDVRISRMFEILPQLGYRLEWCNLDRNVSSATWRSEQGTIVLADTWTWIPLPLKVIAPQVGMVKYDMPRKAHPDSEWARYCMQDAEILYNVVRVLMEWVTSQGLGNWQPTGAGMAYTTWRHKFMDHKVLVHDDQAALQAERSAMHTGRAEAWRHGELYGKTWTEVDLRTAYLAIAAETELPRKLHMHSGPVTIRQYNELRSRFAVLCRVQVTTQVPCVPWRYEGRFYWPTGTLETWLWDCEVDIAIRSGAEVRIRESYTYVRDPILQGWAEWVLGVLGDQSEVVSPVVRTHVKHCSRALIGRLSLRTPSWEEWGDNPEGITGITHVTFPETGRTTRLLHVGDVTLIETARTEAKDSMPMITGYIMSKCRAMLWEGMNVAGLDHIAHVDTDSLLVDDIGLQRLHAHYGLLFDQRWQVKGSWQRLDMWGPRQYFRGTERVSAGVPQKAEEVTRGEYTGEQWSSLSSDLEAKNPGVVRVRPGTWTMKRQDPRRGEAGGGLGATRAYDVAELSSPNGSTSAATGAGS